MPALGSFTVTSRVNEAHVSTGMLLRSMRKAESATRVTRGARGLGWTGQWHPMPAISSVTVTSRVNEANVSNIVLPCSIRRAESGKVDRIQRSIVLRVSSAHTMPVGSISSLYGHPHAHVSSSMLLILQAHGIFEDSNLRLVCRHRRRPKSVHLRRSALVEVTDFEYSA